MAQLAQCPQCDHELFVPGEVTGETRLRCPSCRAFFQLKEAHAREIASVDVSDNSADEPDAEIYTKQTVDDLSTMATWDGEINDDLDSDSTTEPFKPMGLHIAESVDEEAIDIDQHETIDFTVGDKDADELISEFESSETGEDYVPVADEEPPQHAELHVAEIEDNLGDADVVEEESPEAAAQRIDAWFRSAKTLEDLPPVSRDAIEPPADAADDFIPAELAETEDEMDFDKTAKFEASDDFDLSSQSESDAPAWDDSQHIDRLLAEVKDQPPGEYIPLDAEIASEPTEEDEHEHVTTANAEWTPEESYSMTASGREPGSKKSLARTLLMTVVGGLMGLALGYYALLWLGIDILGAAHYLPQAMRPAAFKSPQRVATAPLSPTTSTEQPETTTPDSPAAPSSEETQQAKTATTDPAVEPATFNEPSAAPVKPAEPVAVQVTGAPSFAADELSAALEVGAKAEPNLVNGNLSDGNEVAKRKGYSYSILADLAQKLTFTTYHPGEVTNWELKGNQLFQTILANPHARDEVAQIVPKWIASPNRKQGGVFFAGSVQTSEPKGSVAECTVEFGGQSLPVLVPAAAAEQVKASAAPVAVVGWIVNDPAKNVAGYTGNAPQAIFATKLLPLE